MENIDKIYKVTLKTTNGLKDTAYGQDDKYLDVEIDDIEKFYNVSWDKAFDMYLDGTYKTEKNEDGKYLIPPENKEKCEKELENELADIGFEYPYIYQGNNCLSILPNLFGLGWTCQFYVSISMLLLGRC